MESLVIGIPGGDGKVANLFYSVALIMYWSLNYAWFYIVKTRGLRMMADFVVLVLAS